MKPNWLKIAEGEIGVKEIPGDKSAPKIDAYHATTTLKATSDEVPWCAAFVNWCFKQAGIKGTNLANARSWLAWGVKLTEPIEGCVVVFKRGLNPKAGHVGFFVASDDKYLYILGGNQSDSVRVSRYQRSTVLGYRWPIL